MLTNVAVWSKQDKTPKADVYWPFACEMALGIDKSVQAIDPMWLRFAQFRDANVARREDAQGMKC